MFRAAGVKSTAHPAAGHARGAPVACWRSEGPAPATQGLRGLRRRSPPRAGAPPAPRRQERRQRRPPRAGRPGADGTRVVLSGAQPKARPLRGHDQAARSRARSERADRGNGAPGAGGCGGRGGRRPLPVRDPDNLPRLTPGAARKRPLAARLRFLRSGRTVVRWSCGSAPRRCATSRTSSRLPTWSDLGSAPSLASITTLTAFLRSHATSPLCLRSDPGTTRAPSPA